MQKFSLKIPGISETKATLAQPISLRLIPWLILFQAIISLFTSTSLKLVASFNTYPVSWFKPAMILLPSLISLAIAYFLASRIRHGDVVFIWFLKITTALSIVGSFVQTYFFITRFDSSFPQMNMEIIFLILSAE